MGRSKQVSVEGKSGLWYGARAMADEIEDLLPKKKPPSPGPGRPRTTWAPDVFWNEIAAVAKAEGLSVSEFALSLIKVGYAVFKKTRAKQQEDEKP